MEPGHCRNRRIPVLEPKTKTNTITLATTMIFWCLDCGILLAKTAKGKNKRTFWKRFSTLTENPKATQCQIQGTTIESIRLVPIRHFKTSQLLKTKTNTKSTFTTTTAFGYFCGQYLVGGCLPTKHLDRRTRGAENFSSWGLESTGRGQWTRWQQRLQLFQTTRNNRTQTYSRRRVRGSKLHSVPAGGGRALGTNIRN